MKSPHPKCGLDESSPYNTKTIWFDESSPYNIILYRINKSNPFTFFL
jgi:hypothetical protein